MPFLVNLQINFCLMNWVSVKYYSLTKELLDESILEAVTRDVLKKRWFKNSAEIYNKTPSFFH